MSVGIAAQWPIDSSIEEEWVAGLRAGRVEIFRIIFETYAPRLQHFACVWVSSDLAEDVVQDVLFDIWQRRDTLDLLDARLGPYLFSAVRKRIAHHLRHRGVEVRTEQDATFIDPIGMGTAPASPDAQIISEQLETFMMEILKHLSNVQRSVLMLRWTQGLSYSEIAAALSLSENAVKLHMSRARQSLRPLLQHISKALDLE